MSTTHSILFLILLSSSISLSPNCTEGLNHCITCNKNLNICTKCEYTIYTPDETGGCTAAKKCTIGENYCTKCNSEFTLCNECSQGFPDENGGCSLIPNCNISLNGKCIKCNDDYILIEQKTNLQICKYIYSEDYKNCEKINYEDGTCEKCKNKFFLTENDKKCVETENCYESLYGVCTSCIIGYYLNKKTDICKKQQVKNKLWHCKISLDGNDCDECEDEYFLTTGDIRCVTSNYCYKANYEICKNCITGYYLSKNNNACTQEKLCLEGDLSNGICYICPENYYINYNNWSCISNQENNEFKYCKKAKNKCLFCIDGYYFSKDNKCTNTKKCIFVENGKCMSCEDGYILSENNLCLLPNCISYENSECIECEKSYYYDPFKEKCILKNGIFENCKRATYDGNFCLQCDDNFYLEHETHLCKDNTDKNSSYYKCDYEIGNQCIICKKNYYLGSDNLCSKIAYCKTRLNENECSECIDNFCLNKKTGLCIYNLKVENEEEKFIFGCKYTNDEGTKCEKCSGERVMNNEGICINENICEKKDSSGNCIKCVAKEYSNQFYCLNKDVGCVDTYTWYCQQCDKVTDFEYCNKCQEHYELNGNYVCTLSEIEVKEGETEEQF